MAISTQYTLPPTPRAVDPLSVEADSFTVQSELADALHDSSASRLTLLKEATSRLLGLLAMTVRLQGRLAPGDVGSDQALLAPTLADTHAVLDEMRNLGLNVGNLPLRTPVLRLGTSNGFKADDPNNALLWMTPAEIDAISVDWLPGSPTEPWQLEPDAGVLTDWDATASLKSSRRGSDSANALHYAVFDNRANRPITRQTIESWTTQLPGLILDAFIDVIGAQQDVRAGVDEATKVMNSATEGTRRERSAGDKRLEDRTEQTRRAEVRNGDLQRRLLYPELMPYEQPPTRRIAEE
jgi:hypothetical protein